MNTTYVLNDPRKRNRHENDYQRIEKQESQIEKSENRNNENLWPVTADVGIPLCGTLFKRRVVYATALKKNATQNSFVTSASTVDK